jgi:hypothetical protein
MEGKYYPSFRVDGHGLCKLEKMNTSKDIVLYKL